MTRTLKADLVVADLAASDRVDTSLLLEELKGRYRATGRPLDVSFRGLVGWVKPGDRLTHLVHPYPAKLLPHIAHFFAHASSLRRVGPNVLDPFAGSGTVALEASIAGAKPLVADANPLALLVAKVKTTPYDSDVLVDEARRLKDRIRRLRTAPSIKVLNEHIWYFPETKQALERILRAVLEVEDEDVRDFFRVCFSVVARRLSRADPSISVPVRLAPKPRLSAASNKAIRSHLRWIKETSPSDEFLKVVQANIARVLATNRAFRGRLPCVVVGTDARVLKDDLDRRLESESIHLTITSPPYGSAQKYIRSSSLSLNWLSLCSPDELANLEGRSIGREHLPAKLSAPLVPLLPSVAEVLGSTLDRIRAKNSHRASITETYLSELTAALGEMVRVTAPGGSIALVVGNNTVAGFALPNDQVISAVLDHLGMRLELALKDTIHSRGLLTARHATAGVIGGETILLYRKSLK